MHQVGEQLDELRGNQLEDELISFHPRIFCSIEDFVSKYYTLLQQVIAHIVNRKEE